MLTVVETLPEGILDVEAKGLCKLLPGPTLIHLQGRRRPALFVSVLLHGNEESGLRAAQGLLRKYAGQELPRALSLLIGNVAAARYGARSLDQQPDYNRIWREGPTLEHAMTRRVLDEMKTRGVFASVDLHNNTGINPHYACVNRLEDRFFHLAILFSRTVVYFTRPEGVQAAAFAELCPAVTLECGQAGQTHGIEHAQDYLEACLHLSEIPRHPVPPHDMDLFHSVAVIKVPEHASIGVGSEDADIRLVDDLDHLNFSELSPDTLLGWRRGSNATRLVAWDENGREVGERYFAYRGDEIRTKAPFMPSMLTLNKPVIRQDCLGYVMERLTGGGGSALPEREAGPTNRRRR
jgi:succinylglutamate desuccinylase